MNPRPEWKIVETSSAEVPDIPKVSEEPHNFKETPQCQRWSEAHNVMIERVLASVNDNVEDVDKEVQVRVRRQFLANCRTEPIIERTKEMGPRSLGMVVPQAEVAADGISFGVISPLPLHNLMTLTLIPDTSSPWGSRLT